MVELLWCGPIISNHIQPITHRTAKIRALPTRRYPTWRPRCDQVRLPSLTLCDPKVWWRKMFTENTAKKDQHKRLSSPQHRGKNPKKTWNVTRWEAQNHLQSGCEKSEEVSSKKNHRVAWCINRALITWMCRDRQVARASTRFSREKRHHLQLDLVV